MTGEFDDPPKAGGEPEITEDKARALATVPTEAPATDAAPPISKKSGRTALLVGGAIVAAVVVIGVFLAKRQLASAPSEIVESVGGSPETATLDLPAQEAAAVSEPAHAGVSVSPEKIFNATSDQMKTGAEAIGRSGAQAPGTVTDLPAPPADFGAAGLQEAAKDAAKLLRPEAGAIDLSNEDPQAAIDRLERAAEPPGAYVAPDAAAGDSAALAAEVAGLKSALQLEVASLAGSLGAERRRADEQSLEIARLNAELQRLKAQGAPDGGRGQAALALAALAQKARSGAAYRAEYDAYGRMATGARDLAALEARADAGLPTLADLKKNFAGPRNDALDLARRTAARGPMARLGANVAALIDLRPARPIEGDGAAAVLSRAEARLETDDLAGAVAELAALSETQAAPLASWLVEARARLEAEKALQSAFGRTLSAGPQGGAE